MSDSIINDSTPKGNVILAFGVSTPFFRRRQILVAMVFAMVSAVVLTMVAYAGLIQMPFPKNPVVVVALRSGDVPSWAPQAWVDAARESRTSYGFYGLERQADGSMTPFVVVPKWATLSGSRVVGLWKISRFGREETEQRRVVDVFGSWAGYRSSGWLHVWPSTLGGSAEPTARTGLFGPIHDTQWDILSADFPQTISGLHDLKQNGVIFAGLPGAWDGFRDVLLKQGIRLPETPMPRAAQWSWGLGGSLRLQLDFDQPMTTQERAAMMAALGGGERQMYTLPDGGVVSQTVVPRQVTSSTFEGTLGQSHVEAQRVTVGSGDPLASEAVSHPACPGTPILFLDQISVRKSTDLLGMNASRSYSLVWASEQGMVHVCW